jgi:hypothetical protein
VSDGVRAKTNAIEGFCPVNEVRVFVSSGGDTDAIVAHKASGWRSKIYLRQCKVKEHDSASDRYPAVGLSSSHDQSPVALFVCRRGQVNRPVRGYFIAYSGPRDCGDWVLG